MDPADEKQKDLFVDMTESEETGVDEPSITNETPPKRKLQVSNGYLFDAEQFSRVFNAVWERRNEAKISRKVLSEATGFPDRQVESLISMGCAMGLIKPNVQCPTPEGSLVAEFDMFFENPGTLQWCHYKGAGTRKNLVWFEVFNDLLRSGEAATQGEWTAYFRKALAGKYSDRTLRKVLQEEVRFIVDGYLEGPFKVLNLLEYSGEKKIRRRRYVDIDPLLFCAMLYDLHGKTGESTFDTEDLAVRPGSPAVIFGLDLETLGNLSERMHASGYVRYERTHGLDQIRLKGEYGYLDFLSAYYERREPEPGKGEM